MLCYPSPSPGPLDVSPGLAGVGVPAHSVQRLALAVGYAQLLGSLTCERYLLVIITRTIEQPAMRLIRS